MKYLKKVTKTNRIVIDLFCGAGGLSEGFRKEGFKTILAIDNNPRALETFSKNHPESKTICIDVSKLTPEILIKEIKNRKIDLIIGGPPCQGFSTAGKRDPNDPRNALVKNFLNLVSKIKPKGFVIENVPGLLSMKTKKGVKTIQLIEKMAESAGYKISINLLNAEDYSVPQRRRRVFIIGCKNKKIDVMQSKREKVPVGKILIPEKEIPASYFYSKERILGAIKRRENNRRKGLGFGWQFLDPKKPSYTIRARYYKDGSEALVKYSNDKIRMLTPEECAAIQSFPSSYKFVGGKIQKYIQVGNAVPPKLAQVVAKSIKTAFHS